MGWALGWWRFDRRRGFRFGCCGKYLNEIEVFFGFYVCPRYFLLNRNGWYNGTSKHIRWLVPSQTYVLPVRDFPRWLHQRCVSYHWTRPSKPCPCRCPRNLSECDWNIEHFQHLQLKEKKLFGLAMVRSKWLLNIFFELYSCIRFECVFDKSPKIDAPEGKSAHDLFWRPRRFVTFFFWPA